MKDVDIDFKFWYNFILKTVYNESYVSYYRDTSVQSEVYKKAVKFERVWNPDKQSGMQDTQILINFLRSSEIKKNCTKSLGGQGISLFSTPHIYAALPN